jgi:pimeloyl-ACP methyl ester carboxylesterase
LAIAAVLNRNAALKAERAHPAKGRFVEVDGIDVHYFDVGRGSPVVLLHGNGAMAEDFAISGLTARLAQHHRVIAIDRPGFGFTPRTRDRIWTPFAQARLVRDVLDRLGIQKPVVLGHSWGTQVAVALALEPGIDLAGLVLLSGYYYPTARADVVFLSGPAVPVIGDLMRYTVSPPIARAIAPGLFKRIFQPREVPRRFHDRFPLDLALRPWQLRASAEDTAMMVPAAYALSDRYGELSLPVTIIAGDGDRIATTARQSARLHDELPDSDLIVVPGVGHMIHYAVPEKIVSAVGRIGSR